MIIHHRMERQHRGSRVSQPRPCHREMHGEDNCSDIMTTRQTAAGPMARAVGSTERGAAGEEADRQC